MKRSREILSPKLEDDKKSLAFNGVVEAMRLRTEVLPTLNPQAPQEYKRLLKEGVSILNQLNIFPTFELCLLSDVPPYDDTEWKEFKLVFVGTKPKPGGNYRDDYYLTPKGELVKYLCLDDVNLGTFVVTDEDYVDYTKAALLAVEKRIEESMVEKETEPRASGRIDLGQRLFSGTATKQDVNRWIKENPHG